MELPLLLSRVTPVLLFSMKLCAASVVPPIVMPVELVINTPMPLLPTTEELSDLPMPMRLPWIVEFVT